MDSPIHTNYIQPGGAITLIFIVDGADAVGSFVTRSTVPWNIAVPPDGIKLAYEFLRMSASHSICSCLSVRLLSLSSCLSLEPVVWTRFSLICSQHSVLTVKWVVCLLFEVIDTRTSVFFLQVADVAAVKQDLPCAMHDCGSWTG